MPVVQGGAVEFFVGDAQHTVHLTRAHLEEDAGKSLHEDYARPDRHRPEPRRHAAAGDRHRARHALERRGGRVRARRCTRSSSGSASATATCRKAASAATPTSRCASPARRFGTRREIKNLNSFKFLQQAIDYEVQWQIDLHRGRRQRRAGHRAVRPRQRRDARDAQQGRRARLPLLPRPRPAAAGDRAGVDRARCAREMPELPRAMAARFQRDYGLPAYDAAMMTQSQAFARLLRGGARRPAASPSWSANWLMGEVSRRLNAEASTSTQAPVAAADAGRADRAASPTARSRTTPRARCSTRCGPASGGDVDAIIEAKGLQADERHRRARAIVDEVLAANAEVGRGIPRRQGQGVQRAGRPGDEGEPRARPTRRRSTSC